MGADMLKCTGKTDADKASAILERKVSDVCDTFRNDEGTGRSQRGAVLERMVTYFSKRFGKCCAGQPSASLKGAIADGFQLGAEAHGGQGGASGKSLIAKDFQFGAKRCGLQRFASVKCTIANISS